MEEFNRENYRDYDAVNVSKLSQLDRNPSKVDKEKDFHDGMAFGSLVDLMCFEPDKVEEEFYVNEADRDPSGTAKELADWIFENKDNLKVWNKNIYNGTNNSNLSDLETLLKQAEEAVGSSTNFEKYGGVDYLKAQIESQDKYVVSEELYKKARQAKMTLFTHDFTSDYFNDNRSHIEIQHQVPLLWDPSYYDDELDCQAKSLLDTVIFDHRNKTVRPVDLKTTSSSVHLFERKMKKWGYYLQASYYTDGLYWIIQNHDEINDYEVLPFEFKVISSKSLNHPLVYTCTQNDLLCGREGGVLSYGNREVKGWVQLIKDLNWHEKHQKWDYSREVYENNGKVELDIFE